MKVSNLEWIFRSKNLETVKKMVMVHADDAQEGSIYGE